jgi:endonuclease YncB( thermonuclease family)
MLLFLSVTIDAAMAGEPCYGTVKKVIDGDSLLLSVGRKHVEVRLYGVDAPEYQQSFGVEAKNFVRQWTLGQRIMVQPEYKDTYGRTVAIISKGQRILNEDLVQAGMAWVYPRYCRKEVCDSWQEMEKAARGKKLGLWHSSQPIPPWQWKRFK